MPPAAKRHVARAVVEDPLWRVATEIYREFGGAQVAVLQFAYRMDDISGIVILSVKLESSEVESDEEEAPAALPEELILGVSVAALRRLLRCHLNGLDEFRRRSGRPTDWAGITETKRFNAADNVLKAVKEAQSMNRKGERSAAWDVWWFRYGDADATPSKAERSFENHVRHLKKIGWLRGRISSYDPERADRLQPGPEYEKALHHRFHAEPEYPDMERYELRIGERNESEDQHGEN